MSMNKIVRIGAITMAVGIIGVVSMVFFLGYNFFLEDVKHVNLHKTVNAKEATQIEINSNVGDINLHLSKQDEVLAEMTGKVPQGNEVKFEVFESNHKITVTMEQREKRLFDFSFGKISEPPVLNVYIPEKMYESLHVKTRLGDIHGNQALLAKTMTVNTASGDISLSGFRGDQLNVRSHLGDIELGQIDATVDVTADSGDITVRPLLNAKKDNRIQSKLGDVTVQLQSLPKSLYVDLATNLGSIDTDFPVTAVTSGKKELVEVHAGLKGYIGEQSDNSAQLHVKTDSGNVILQK